MGQLHRDLNNHLSMIDSFEKQASDQLESLRDILEEQVQTMLDEVNRIYQNDYNAVSLDEFKDMLNEVIEDLV